MNLAHQVFLEHEARLDPSALARLAHQANQDPLAQWDHQDSPDQMERKETPALQV